MLHFFFFLEFKQQQHSLPLTKLTQPVWYKTISLWLPAQHPLVRTRHIYRNTSYTNINISCLAARSLLVPYVQNGRGTKEDVAGGGEKEEKRKQPSKGPHRRVLVRGCQAFNQSYLVLYQASWAHCVSGRGVVLPVTSH